MPLFALSSGCGPQEKAASAKINRQTMAASLLKPIMINLKNVERSYKTGAGQTWVLRRVDLTIQKGEFITVMGPSGAGKSSLLNVLALLDDQWAGEYWFGEQPVHLMKRK